MVKIYKIKGTVHRKFSDKLNFKFKSYFNLYALMEKIEQLN